MQSLDTIPPPIYYLRFLYNTTLGLLPSWEQKEEYLSVWDSSAVETYICNRWVCLYEQPPFLLILYLVFYSDAPWLGLGSRDAESLGQGFWSTDSWGGAVQWTLSGRKSGRETETRQDVALAEAQPQSDPTGNSGAWMTPWGKGEGLLCRALTTWHLWQDISSSPG